MTQGTGPAAVAAQVAELARAGCFEQIAERFAPPLRALVSVEALRDGWDGHIARIGAVSAIGAPVGEPAERGVVKVSVPVTGERGGLTMSVAVDDAGLLRGLLLTAEPATAWTPPPYADPDRFDEHEVAVGSGALAVSGTLSLPHGRGPWPGVVLLGGGGPFDRDATTGPNKPLKDLAWGLACRGVAVLRFDKVTHTHPQRLPADYTMADEYVPHAVAAVRLLRRHPAVDAERVHLAGHSMGGKVAPRVAAAEPSVAGLVLLAADAQPMQHAAVRVVRHLAALDPGLRAAAETITRQAALVDGPDLTPDTPAAQLPLGYSAAYWLDLRAYDPVATAAALERPMLILQGGRDYQVTIADDLARWKAGLAHRPDVVITVHDADDHLFFPGSGPSVPADYHKPQHLDADVVTDIADWLTAPRSAGSAQSAPGAAR
ncbi:alpha/beta hydrolase family protein [Spirillospora sp. NPDC050679]